MIRLVPSRTSLAAGLREAVSRPGGWLVAGLVAFLRAEGQCQWEEKTWPDLGDTNCH